MRTSLSRGVLHFSYMPLLGIAAAGSLAKLLLYANLIGVTEFGALSKMFLVSAGFGMAGSLGMHSVVSRDLPALLARGRARRGYWLLAQTIGVTTLVAAVAIATALSGLPWFDLAQTEVALGVLHGWAQLVFLTVATDSRSRLLMTRYAEDMALRNLSIALAGVTAAMLDFGAHGIVVAEIVLTLLSLVLTTLSMRRRAALSWDWLAAAHRPRAPALPWRAALLVLAGGMAMFASLNLDRWVAAEALTRQSFGIYSFGWIVLLAAQSVQGLLNSSLMPLLARRRAQELHRSAYRLTKLMSLTLCAGGLVLVLPTAWLLGWVVAHLIPQYSPASPLWLPLLLAAVFRVADFWSSLLLVMGHEGRLLVIQASAVLSAGVGYALWLWQTGAAPEPHSLAWLACSTAVLSHAASAGAVVRACRVDLSP